MSPYKARRKAVSLRRMGWDGVFIPQNAESRELCTLEQA